MVIVIRVDRAVGVTSLTRVVCEYAGTIVNRSRVVIVARCRSRTSSTCEVLTGTIIVGSRSVVVARTGILTTSNFFFVTYEVLVSVIQAVTIAIDNVVWVPVRVSAGTVIVGSRFVVVARSGILASCDFVLITDQITVCIIEAVAVTIKIVSRRIGTGSVIVRRSTVIVASFCIGTSGNLVLITNTVGIRIVQTVAVAIQVGCATAQICRILTGTVIIGGCIIIVACR